MYLLVLLAIAVFIIVLFSVNKCHDKPFKDEGKCVSKCDNYIDEDGITCVDSCPNFTDEESKKCLAQCPSYKPYSQEDKFCSPYNVLNTETNSFNLKRYSSDASKTVVLNELSCSQDTKVIAIKRIYNSQGVDFEDYFISTDFGNNFTRYPDVPSQDEIFSLVKVSPLGECIVVVSNFMLTVYKGNIIYSITDLEKETDTIFQTEEITDYKILDEMNHYYLYNLTHVDKEAEVITDKKHGIKVSTDYGKTFNVLAELSINDINLLSGKLCVSKDKKELLFTVENTETNNSKLFTSSDYGKTFTSYEIKGKVNAIDCNATGSCKVITTYTGLPVPDKGYIYVSTDYGLTWKESGVDQSITNIKLLAMSERGQNQLFLFEKGSSKNGILISKDYGNTFKVLHESTDANNMIRGAGMTLDSKFITICTNSTIKISSDYGETFKQNINQYTNLGSDNVSSQVCISSSNYNYLNGKIQIILGSSNSLFYTTLL